jgi:glycosyltransferase involved in cell wall biosynthesis
MKILNVNTSLDPVNGGGTAERTFQMSRFLAKAGADCTVLVTDLGLTPERIKELQGVEVVAYPCLSKRFYIPRGSYKKIWNLVADTDIIHLMNHWSFLNALVYLMAKDLQKPYVVCPAGALSIYGRSRILKRLYNLIIGKNIIRQADGQIAIAPVEMTQFRAYGIPPEKISIIPNGVDAGNFLSNDTGAFRKKFGLGDAPFILFMGRLNSIKGPDLLVQAFCNIRENIKSHHLVFAGPDGGMLNRLKEMAAAANISNRVHFTGYLGGDDKSQAYHAAELLVVPSRQEAMSIVVLEAGVTGTPVLITDQCGFDEVLTIGGGRVVPATTEGLQSGLHEVLKEPDGLNAMGERLKHHVKSHFAWDIIASRYLAYYARHLGKPF